jgi:hypothetical protein
MAGEMDGEGGLGSYSSLVADPSHDRYLPAFILITGAFFVCKLVPENARYIRQSLPRI